MKKVLPKVKGSKFLFEFSEVLKAEQKTVQEKPQKTKTEKRPHPTTAIKPNQAPENPNQSRKEEFLS